MSAPLTTHADTFLLRLPSELDQELRRIALAEGVTLQSLITDLLTIGLRDRNVATITSMDGQTRRVIREILKSRQCAPPHGS